MYRASAQKSPRAAAFSPSSPNDATTLGRSPIPPAANTLANSGGAAAPPPRALPFFRSSTSSRLVAGASGSAQSPQSGTSSPVPLPGNANNSTLLNNTANSSAGDSLPPPDPRFPPDGALTFSAVEYPPSFHRLATAVAAVLRAQQQQQQLVAVAPALASPPGTPAQAQSPLGLAAAAAQQQQQSAQQRTRSGGLSGRSSFDNTGGDAGSFGQGSGNGNHGSFDAIVELEVETEPAPDASLAADTATATAAVLMSQPNALRSAPTSTGNGGGEGDYDGDAAGRSATARPALTPRPATGAPMPGSYTGASLPGSLSGASTLPAFSYAASSMPGPASLLAGHHGPGAGAGAGAGAAPQPLTGQLLAAARARVFSLLRTLRPYLAPARFRPSSAADAEAVRDVLLSLWDALLRDRAWGVCFPLAAEDVTEGAVADAAAVRRAAVAARLLAQAQAQSGVKAGAKTNRDNGESENLFVLSPAGAASVVGGARSGASASALADTAAVSAPVSHLLTGLCACCTGPLRDRDDRFAARLARARAHNARSNACDSRANRGQDEYDDCEDEDKDIAVAEAEAAAAAAVAGKGARAPPPGECRIAHLLLESLFYLLSRHELHLHLLIAPAAAPFMPLPPGTVPTPVPGQSHAAAAQAAAAGGATPGPLPPLPSPYQPFATPPVGMLSIFAAPEHADILLATPTTTATAPAALPVPFVTAETAAAAAAASAAADVAAAWGARATIAMGLDSDLSALIPTPVGTSTSSSSSSAVVVASSSSGSSAGANVADAAAGAAAAGAATLKSAAASLPVPLRLSLAAHPAALSAHSLDSIGLGIWARTRLVLRHAQSAAAASAAAAAATAVSGALSTPTQSAADCATTASDSSAFAANAAAASASTATPTPVPSAPPSSSAWARVAGEQSSLLRRVASLAARTARLAQRLLAFYSPSVDVATEATALRAARRAADASRRAKLVRTVARSDGKSVRRWECRVAGGGRVCGDCRLAAAEAVAPFTDNDDNADCERKSAGADPEDKSNESDDVWIDFVTDADAALCLSISSEPAAVRERDRDVSVFDPLVVPVINDANHSNAASLTMTTSSSSSSYGDKSSLRGRRTGPPLVAPPRGPVAACAPGAPEPTPPGSAPCRGGRLAAWHAAVWPIVSDFALQTLTVAATVCPESQLPRELELALDAHRRHEYAAPAQALRRRAAAAAATTNDQVKAAATDGVPAAPTAVLRASESFLPRLLAAISPAAGDMLDLAIAVPTPPGVPAAIASAAAHEHEDKSAATDVQSEAKTDAEAGAAEHDAVLTHTAPPAVTPDAFQGLPVAPHARLLALPHTVPAPGARLRRRSQAVDGTVPSSGAAAANNAGAGVIARAAATLPTALPTAAAAHLLGLPQPRARPGAPPAGAAGMATLAQLRAPARYSADGLIAAFERETLASAANGDEAALPSAVALALVPALSARGGKPVPGPAYLADDSDTSPATVAAAMAAAARDDPSAAAAAAETALAAADGAFCDWDEGDSTISAGANTYHRSAMTPGTFASAVSRDAHSFLLSAAVPLLRRAAFAPPPAFVDALTPLISPTFSANISIAFGGDGAKPENDDECEQTCSDCERLLSPLPVWSSFTPSLADDSYPRLCVHTRGDVYARGDTAAATLAFNRGRKTYQQPRAKPLSGNDSASSSFSGSRISAMTAAAAVTAGDAWWLRGLASPVALTGAAPSAAVAWGPYVAALNSILYPADFSPSSSSPSSSFSSPRQSVTASLAPGSNSRSNASVASAAVAARLSQLPLGALGAPSAAVADVDQKPLHPLQASMVTAAGSITGLFSAGPMYGSGALVDAQAGPTLPLPTVTVRARSEVVDASTGALRTASAASHSGARLHASVSGESDAVNAVPAAAAATLLLPQGVPALLSRVALLWHFRSGPFLFGFAAKWLSYVVAAQGSLTDLLTSFAEAVAVDELRRRAAAVRALAGPGALPPLAVALAERARTLQQQQQQQQQQQLIMLQMKRLLQTSRQADAAAAASAAAAAAAVAASVAVSPTATDAASPTVSFGLFDEYATASPGATAAAKPARDPKQFTATAMAAQGLGTAFSGAKNRSSSSGRNGNNAATTAVSPKPLSKAAAAAAAAEAAANALALQLRPPPAIPPHLSSLSLLSLCFPALRLYWPLAARLLQSALSAPAAARPSTLPVLECLLLHQPLAPYMLHFLLRPLLLTSRVLARGEVDAAFSTAATWLAELGGSPAAAAQGLLTDAAAAGTARVTALLQSEFGDITLDPIAHARIVADMTTPAFTVRVAGAALTPTTAASIAGAFALAAAASVLAPPPPAPVLPVPRSSPLFPSYSLTFPLPQDPRLVCVHALASALRLCVATGHFQSILKALTFLYALLGHLYGPARLVVLDTVVFHAPLFRALFLHWCPEVRKVFHLLLLYRVARASDPLCYDAQYQAALARAERAQRRAQLATAAALANANSLKTGDDGMLAAVLLADGANADRERGGHGRGRERGRDMGGNSDNDNSSRSRSRSHSRSRSRSRSQSRTGRDKSPRSAAAATAAALLESSLPPSLVAVDHSVPLNGPLSPLQGAAVVAAAAARSEQYRRFHADRAEGTAREVRREGFADALGQALSDPTRSDWYGEGASSSGGNVGANAPDSSAARSSASPSSPVSPPVEQQPRQLRVTHKTPNLNASNTNLAAASNTGSSTPRRGRSRGSPSPAPAPTGNTIAGGGQPRGARPRAATPAPLVGGALRGAGGDSSRRSASASAAGTAAVAIADGVTAASPNESRPSFLSRVLGVFGMGNNNGNNAGKKGSGTAGLVAARTTMVSRERARLSIGAESCAVAHTLLTVSELAMDVLYVDLLHRYVDDLRTQHDNGWHIPPVSAPTVALQQQQVNAVAVTSPSSLASSSQVATPATTTGTVGKPVSTKPSLPRALRPSTTGDPLHPGNYRFDPAPNFAASAAGPLAAAPSGGAGAGAMLVVPASLRPYLRSALGEFAHHERNYRAVQDAAPFPAPPHSDAIARGPGAAMAATAAEAWGAARAMAAAAASAAEASAVGGVGTRNVAEALWGCVADGRVRGDGLGVTGELIVHGFVRLPELQFSIDASKVPG